MAEKESSKLSFEQIKRNIEKSNERFQQLIQKINIPIRGQVNQYANQVNLIDNEVNKIISSEIGGLMGSTANDVSTFLIKLFSDREKQYGAGEIKSIEDIIGNDNSLLMYFQNAFRDKYDYYDNLLTIMDQLYELNSAVYVVRDSIITSDDISRLISKELHFKNMDSEDTKTVISSILSLESKMKLDVMIKDRIVPNTLTLGNYYVYVRPYSDLFKSHYYRKSNDPRYNVKPVSESVSLHTLKENADSVIDSISTMRGRPLSPKDSSFVSDRMKSLLNNVRVISDDIPIPVAEGVDVSGILDSSTFRKRVEKEVKDVNKTSSKYTGIFGSEKTVSLDKELEEFDNVKGCYVKTIDPRFIIPIKILDYTLGYIYVHKASGVASTLSTTGTIGQRFSTGLSQSYINNIQQDESQQFIRGVADMIVQSFNKKFLDDNVEFKELIVNALKYHDIFNNQLNFQFIPTEYITHFKIDEDEDGDGQSMLKKTIFYANLYRALLLFKMVSIINKSNDTRIYYIKNSGIDKNITNQVHRIAREVKSSQMNYLDLFNYNSMISKIGSKEIYMPVGKSGEKAIEFDILSGQDIQLNTDLMDMLRTNMVNSTDVPSVYMDFINEADYSKTLDVANVKFMKLIVGRQISFNESLTDMYRKIIRFSGLAITEDMIDRFFYTLTKPRSRNLENDAEIFSRAMDAINSRVDVVLGQADQNKEEYEYVKAYVIDKLIRKYVPSEMWDDIDTLVTEARLMGKKELNKIKADEGVE